MEVHVTLRSDKADQFDRIKEDLEDRLGHEPTNADLVAFLMAEYESERNERVLP